MSFISPVKASVDTTLFVFALEAEAQGLFDRFHTVLHRRWKDQRRL